VLDYDSELRAHNERLLAFGPVERGETVLDVGCGAGQTSRDAARLSVTGSVLGVDVSEAMLERARSLTAAAGLGNVTYELADAERHRFEPEHFDVVVSRFGLMFFADPAAAFANLARALRPGGRLVGLVWQAAERNDWARLLDASIPGHDSDASAYGAFSLGDPDTTRAVLEDAGFADVELQDVEVPVHYGPDAGAATEFVRGFGSVRDGLDALDPPARARALERLHAAMEANRGPGGVDVGSRAWLVSATRM
jgi:SAM-dependent methyltransferase